METILKQVENIDPNFSEFISGLIGAEPEEVLINWSIEFITLNS